MAIRDILQLGDPVLRTPADPVEHFDDALRALVEEMFETMYHAEGVGLAAPQIGLSQRIFVVDVRDGTVVAMETYGIRSGPCASMRACSFPRSTLPLKGKLL